MPYKRVAIHIVYLDGFSLLHLYLQPKMHLCMFYNFDSGKKTLFEKVLDSKNCHTSMEWLCLDNTTGVQDESPGHRIKVEGTG